jgi:hypothetical protein
VYQSRVGGEKEQSDRGGRVTQKSRVTEGEECDPGGGGV